MKIVTEIAQRSSRGSAGEERQAGEHESIHALLQKKMKIDEEIAQLKGEVDE